MLKICLASKGMKLLLIIKMSYCLTSLSIWLATITLQGCEDGIDQGRNLFYLGNQLLSHIDIFWLLLTFYLVPFSIKNLTIIILLRKQQPSPTFSFKDAFKGKYFALNRFPERNSRLQRRCQLCLASIMS